MELEVRLKTRGKPCLPFAASHGVAGGCRCVNGVETELRRQIWPRVQKTPDNMWDKKNQHQFTYRISFHPQRQPCDTARLFPRPLPPETEAQGDWLIDPRPPGRWISRRESNSCLSPKLWEPNHGDAAVIIGIITIMSTGNRG